MYRVAGRRQLSWVAVGCTISIRRLAWIRVSVLLRWSGTWRRRCLAIGHSRRGGGGGRGNGPSTSQALLLCPSMLCLKRIRPCLEESILDGPDDIRRKHRSCVDGSWDRLLPRLEHFVHLPSRGVVHHSVGIHKSLIQATTKEKCVWSADVLDYRIKNI
jgi:hypothetical protein